MNDVSYVSLLYRYIDAAVKNIVNQAKLSWCTTKFSVLMLTSFVILYLADEVFFKSVTS